MLAVDAGSVDAAMEKFPGGRQRVVHLRDGAELVMRDAHEATALHSFPASPGWTVSLKEESSLGIWLERDGFRHLLYASGSSPVEEVRLTWPAPVPLKFDLRLVTAGDVVISVGPVFNPRLRLLPLLAGRGVEVGPGANPAVLPEGNRDVSYVERMPMEQWAATYAKKELAAQVAGQWDRYVVDSAHRLDRFADRSLDFVFSSHVIEHLANPLGVFHNWWAKLRSGGIIAGVIPDARHTFDLRQPLTTTEELLAQRAADAYEPTEAMYMRWCRYTSPENTPESLRKREYSIHVNYFSPITFRTLIDLFGFQHELAGMFIESTRNGKDFGFLVTKP